MNRQHVTLLALLDLSAAFDTIDHGILLEGLGLHLEFGIRTILDCIILKWKNSASFNRWHTLNEVRFGMRRTSSFVPRGLGCLLSMLARYLKS